MQLAILAVAGLLASVVCLARHQRDRAQDPDNVLWSITGCVRLTHEPSGAVGEARDSRYQLQNKRAAMARLANTSQFRAWVRLEAARRSGQKPVEQQVEESLEPRNLVVETRDEDGRWQVRFDGRCDPADRFKLTAKGNDE